MSPTLQEAITALKPFFGKSKNRTVKQLNIVKSLAGRFKSALGKGESSVKIIRAFRDTNYGRI